MAGVKEGIYRKKWEEPSIQSWGGPGKARWKGSFQRKKGRRRKCQAWECGESQGDGPEGQHVWDLGRAASSLFSCLVRSS